MNNKGMSKEVLWTIAVIVIVIVILIVALLAWKYGGWETIKSILGIADTYKEIPPPVIN